jgi:hypothetical protein
LNVSDQVIGYADECFRVGSYIIRFKKSELFVNGLLIKYELKKHCIPMNMDVAGNIPSSADWPVFN